MGCDEFIDFLKRNGRHAGLNARPTGDLDALGQSKEPRTQFHIIDSGNGGNTYKENQVIMKNTLVVRHNAGFFSCASIALEDLLVFFNTHKCLPDEVDRTQQFMYYKHLPYDNLIPMLYGETDAPIEFEAPIEIVFDNAWFQWADYKKINFAGLKPFIDKYFAPSEAVLNRVKELEEEYNIDYENTVGVFYRGNDKVKECGVASYEDFAQRTFDIIRHHITNTGRALKILLQPDETECLNHFNSRWEDYLITPSQWLHMPKDSSTAIFMHLPQNERPEHALNLLASVIMLSKCKYLVTHTGNMSFWGCLYRGNMDNVYQWREGEWL